MRKLNLTEFIELRRKLEELEKKCIFTTQKIGEYEILWCGSTTSYPVYCTEIQLDGKKAEYIFDNREMRIEEVQYEKFQALNKLTNILGDISPLQYIFYDLYLQEITSSIQNIFPIDICEIEGLLEKNSELPNTFYEWIDKYFSNSKKISEIEESFNRINEIKEKYLSYDFEKVQKIPKNPLVNEFLEEHKRILADTKNFTNIIVKRIIDKNKPEIDEDSSTIVARVMSEEELMEFKEKGFVESCFSGKERIWRDQNTKGQKGYYTFMVLDTPENVLLNYSTVIPFLSSDDDPKDDNKKIVFFKCNLKDLLQYMYEAGYQGCVRYDEYDSPGLYGQDKSLEMAVPYYLNENFEILLEKDTSKESIKDDFWACVESLNLLGNTENIEYNSALYDDFFKWIKENDIEFQENESVWTYFNEYMYNKEDNPDFEIENIGEEIIKLMYYAMQTSADTDRKDILWSFMDALQKAKYWYYDSCYCEDYDEYDEYEEYDDELENEEFEEESNDSELESNVITEKEIIQTIKDTDIDREKGRDMITYAIGEVVNEKGLE